MENTKFTPGPWAVTERSVAPYKVIVHAFPRRIALCYLRDKAVYVSREQAEANAKLIAASPLMLKALIFSSMFPITTEREADEAEQMALELGWERNMPLENFAIIVVKNAIKKATE